MSEESKFGDSIGREDSFLSKHCRFVDPLKGGFGKIDMLSGYGNGDCYFDSNGIPIYGSEYCSSLTLPQAERYFRGSAEGQSWASAKGDEDPEGTGQGSASGAGYSDCTGYGCGEFGGSGELFGDGFGDDKDFWDCFAKISRLQCKELMDENKNKDPKYFVDIHGVMYKKPNSRLVEKVDPQGIKFREWPANG